MDNILAPARRGRIDRYESTVPGLVLSEFTIQGTVPAAYHDNFACATEHADGGCTVVLHVTPTHRAQAGALLRRLADLLDAPPPA